MEFCLPTSAKTTMRLAYIASVAALVALTGCSSGGSSDGGSTTSNYSINGQIVAPTNAAVDSDVNDRFARYASNDSFALAQTIPSPATIGGYVNIAGAGSSGKSKIAGDTQDYYSVSLTANQVITLITGNAPEQHDIDLYVYDSNQNIVDGSVSNNQIERLTISNAGTYYILVKANAAVTTTATTYVLVIGQAATATATTEPGLTLSSEFVPGEAIVKMRDAITASAAFASPSVLSAQGYSVISGAPDRETLVKLNSVAHNATIASMTASNSATDMQAKLDTLLAIKNLQRQQGVRYAGPNYIYHATKTPNDTRYSLQWHYPLIDLPNAWETTTGDSSVIVAVIDTGVLLNHPDLKNQLVTGYDFIADKTNARDGNGIDSNPDDPGDLALGGTSSFHGTHVSGTIAAASSNNTGVAGIAWDARIMPLRALGTQGGTEYDINQAIRYAAGLSNDSKTVPATNANIINLSLGGPDFSQASQDLYKQVHDQGIIIVAAAGNEATSTPSYPAAYDGVVSVSAVDLQKKLAKYSNRGSTIDIAAPGGDTSQDINGDGYPDGILSTVGDDSSGTIKFVYGFYQGTSMASPHLAGVTALMKSVFPAMTASNFDDLITSGAITEDLGTSGKDNSFGYGLIDAQLAVTAAINAAGGAAPTPTATLVVSPTALNFGLSATQLTLTMKAGNSASVSVTSVTADQAWISISAETVAGSGLGRYRVTVSRTGLSTGSHAGTVSIVSNAGTTTLSVILEVGSSERTGDAGFHYILLVDSETLETLEQTEATAINGVYQYEFTDIAAGNYKIVAGTDLDNNSELCVASEACGAYPTTVSPIDIELNSNITDLNFDTGYNVQLQDNITAAMRKVGHWLRMDLSEPKKIIHH